MPVRALQAVFTSVTVPLGIAAVGCGAAVTQFEPVHASGTSATYPTKSYQLAVGSAEVWCEGVEEASKNDLVDVEMVLRNTSHQPIGLDVDTSSVTVVTHEGKTAPLGKPIRVGGSRKIMPDSAGRIGLRYALPSDLRASDIATFEFQWKVASPVGDVAQRTAFTQVRPTSSYRTWYDAPESCSGAYRPRVLEDCVGPIPDTIWETSAASDE